MTAARTDHDAWLDQQSGFARVLNGNAVERHVRARRKPGPGRVRRAFWRGLRALLAWLAAPSPWSTKP